MSEKTSSQDRIFLITQALCENQVLGLTNKELAKVIKTSETNVCRDMDLFKKYGWVERASGMKWRLSPAFAGMAGSIMKSFQVSLLDVKKNEGRFADAIRGAC